MTAIPLPEPGVDLDIEDIKGFLHNAVRLRPPRFEYGETDATPPREKIEALENYLMESAYAAAELEECLHWLSAVVAHFKRVIENLTGYEAALPGKSRDRLTQADINRAKRIVDPASFDAGAEARHLQESCLRQIERLRFEEQWVISRAYTMISGGS